MKKKERNPLELDKETIARLDEQQLSEIVGGAADNDDEDDTTFTACATGTTCQTGGTCAVGGRP